jgi:hypothetical protein
MLRSALILAAIAGFATATLKSCGTSQYDPTQYVCYNGNFLCPIIAGEALKQCGNACYSTFQYTCTGAALSQLPRTASPVTLTAWNPTVPAIHGQPVTACGLKLWVGGATCAYCPSAVPPPSCPAGTSTVILPAAEAMDVEVPGGQQMFLDPQWFVGYTQAHSAAVPVGSTRGGLVAYQGGGFININAGALGWKSCFSTASGGGGGRWTLVSYNASSQHLYTQCPSVQLKVKIQPSNVFGAWQYT